MPIMRGIFTGIAVSILLVLTIVPSSPGTSIAKVRVNLCDTKAFCDISVNPTNM